MFNKRDKKGFIKFGIFTTIMCILAIIITLNYPVLCVSNNIFGWTVIALVVILLLASPIMFICFITLLIFTLIGNHTTKKNIKRIQSLTNEFRPIFLKPNGNELSSYIPNKEIKCMAKLDENGKIIYKIQVDIEASTENYNAFLSEFEI